MVTNQQTEPKITWSRAIISPLDVLTKPIGQGRIAVRFALGTGVFLFEAYEPNATVQSHAVRLVIGDVVLGEVSSRRIPASVQALPQGPKKWALQDSYHAVYDTEAYAWIVRAFPEAELGVRCSGGIIINQDIL